MTRALDTIQMDTRNLRTELGSLSRTVSLSGRLRTPRGPVGSPFHDRLWHRPFVIVLSRRDALHRAFPYVIQRLQNRFWRRPTRRRSFPRERHVRVRPCHAYRSKDPGRPERHQRHLPNGF